MRLVYKGVGNHRNDNKLVVAWALMLSQDMLALRPMTTNTRHSLSGATKQRVSKSVEESHSQPTLVP